MVIDSSVSLKVSTNVLAEALLKVLLADGLINRATYDASIKELRKEQANGN